MCLASLAGNWGKRWGNTPASHEVWKVSGLGGMMLGKTMGKVFLEPIKKHELPLSGGARLQFQTQFIFI